MLLQLSVLMSLEVPEEEVPEKAWSMVRMRKRQFGLFLDNAQEQIYKLHLPLDKQVMKPHGKQHSAPRENSLTVALSLSGCSASPLSGA